MSNGYFDRLDQVDQILAAGPERCDYEADLQHLLSDQEVEQYFYKHAESPAWLQILAAVDEIEPDPQSRQWPASAYLKKIASDKPEEVSEILCSVADTEDPFLIARICDIAQELPVDHSERLLQAATRWVALPSVAQFGRQLVPLIPEWASGSSVDELLELLSELLQLDDEAYTEQRIFFSPALAAEPRIGNWLYERVLKEEVPKVYQADALGTLTVLTDVLYQAITLGREQGDPTDRIWPDGSQSWRPAIEEHGQNEPEDLTDALIAAVRDYHEAAIDSGKLSLPEAVSELESRRWALFIRLSLHLTRIFGNEHLGIVRNRLTDPTLFYSTACHHEFYLLQQTCFPLLEDSDRQSVLNMIDKEISKEKAQQILERQDMEATVEAAQKYIRARKLRRMSAIADHLSGKRREKYDQLLEEFGQPEHPDFLIYSYGVRSGLVSPKSSSDLAEGSPEEVIRFLNEWAPSEQKGIETPSREGLSQELAELVTNSPEDYVKLAAEFAELPGVYVRGFLDGLARAAEDDKRFKWSELFTMFSTLLDRHSPDEYDEPHIEDQSLSSSILISVTRFIDEALKHTATSPPIDRQDDIWTILAGLMRFPDPPFDEPKPEAEDSFDPIFRAINSVRGKAFYALMRFTNWVDRNTEGSGGFKTLPKVGDLLDWHLDPTNDASLAIRSAYGIWIPWLYYFDKDWLKPRVNQIFPQEENLQDYWWAAWDGFVGYTSPSVPIFGLLKAQYKRAVCNLEEANRRSEGQSSNISKRTAQHIMVLYWKGVLENDDSDLVEVFFRKAPGDLCAESIRFVGRSLRGSDETIPSEVLERLQSLWKWRLSENRHGQGEIASDELVAFAWWFYSGAFDDESSIDLLQQSLELANKIPDNPYMIISQLAQVADACPVAAVSLLRQIADSEEGIWAIRSNDEATTRILRAGLASEAESTARDLVDRLGRLGMMELRNLHSSCEDSG